MEATEKTVEALKVVACPWQKGIQVTLALCQPCKHHGGLKEHFEHRWNQALGKTEPVSQGESISCNYPRTLRVAHVVMGE